MSEPSPTEQHDDYPSRLDWVYTKRGQNRLWAILWILCGLSVLLEVIAWVSGWTQENEVPGVFAVLGFTSCMFMIYLAKWLGKVLKVRPDFYGKEELE